MLNKNMFDHVILLIYICAWLLPSSKSVQFSLSVLGLSSLSLFISFSFALIYSTFEKISFISQFIKMYLEYFVYSSFVSICDDHFLSNLLL